MRTALYGGSFDPIHHGHLLLAREALEQHGLDRVVFIPAAVSPFKLHADITSPGLRLAMVRAAIAGEPQFECDDSEIHRSGPSFTIDTVEAWRTRAPEDEIFYFIGSDNVADLPRWRRSAELLQLAKFIVFERETAESVPAHDYLRVHCRIDISSTQIRKRVAEGRSIRYLVPDAVRAMIAEHRLYHQGDRY